MTADLPPPADPTEPRASRMGGYWFRLLVAFGLFNLVMYVWLDVARKQEPSVSSPRLGDPIDVTAYWVIGIFFFAAAGLLSLAAMGAHRLLRRLFGRG